MGQPIYFVGCNVAPRGSKYLDEYVFQPALLRLDFISSAVQFSENPNRTLVNFGGEGRITQLVIDCSLVHFFALMKNATKVGAD